MPPADTARRPQYAYHVTLTEFLPSIRAQGLLPQEHESADEPVIFVERDEEGAAIYREEDTVMLRIQVEGCGCTKDGEDVLTWRVPPEEIFVRQGKEWAPLVILIPDVSPLPPLPVPEKPGPHLAP